jgi:dipeptidase D
MTLDNLEPRYLWQQFDRIRQVPRPSRHEEKIRAYVLEWAQAKGFEALTDDIGNVVVKVPATPGHEGAPTIVIQAHMDMVCEKNNDVDFDFMNDPIEVDRKGDWLVARGTTLGSDNGVGMAAGMALAEDPDAVHGPLELLITVDEETGLTGAAQLDASLVTGRTLLNLDTEELGALYIGCAGGGDSNLTLPMATVPTPAGYAGFHVKVTGLKGGHSGMDIVEQRGNAIQILARILWKVRAEHGLGLARFEGGGVHNAIPREATAQCVIEGGAMDAVAAIVTRERDAIRVELGETDPGLEVELAQSEAPDGYWGEEPSAALINLLQTIPHGVEAMSREVPGLVETSNNLASVWTRDDTVVIGTSSRSSINSALQAMRDRIRAAGELAGATVEENNAYPGWKPDLSSKVLAVTRSVHEELFGNVPEVKAVHAGLECGIIGEKIPGMDMVSFGPTIEAPHSPDERCNIPSVGTFWKLLKGVAAELARV